MKLHCLPQRQIYVPIPAAIIAAEGDLIDSIREMFAGDQLGRARGAGLGVGSLSLKLPNPPNAGGLGRPVGLDSGELKRVLSLHSSFTTLPVG